MTGPVDPSKSPELVTTGPPDPWAQVALVIDGTPGPGSPPPSEDLVTEYVNGYYYTMGVRLTREEARKRIVDEHYRAGVPVEALSGVDASTEPAGTVAAAANSPTGIPFVPFIEAVRVRDIVLEQIALKPGPAPTVGLTLSAVRPLTFTIVPGTTFIVAPTPGEPAPEGPPEIAFGFVVPTAHSASMPVPSAPLTLTIPAIPGQIAGSAEIPLDEHVDDARWATWNTARWAKWGWAMFAAEPRVGVAAPASSQPAESVPPALSLELIPLAPPRQVGPITWQAFVAPDPLPDAILKLVRDATARASAPLFRAAAGQSQPPGGVAGEQPDAMPSLDAEARNEGDVSAREAREIAASTVNTEGDEFVRLASKIAPLAISDTASIDLRPPVELGPVPITDALGYHVIRVRGFKYEAAFRGNRSIAPDPPKVTITVSAEDPVTVTIPTGLPFLVGPTPDGLPNLGLIVSDGATTAIGAGGPTTVVVPVIPVDPAAIGSPSMRQLIPVIPSHQGPITVWVANEPPPPQPATAVDVYEQGLRSEPGINDRLRWVVRPSLVGSLSDAGSHKAAQAPGFEIISDDDAEFQRKVRDVVASVAPAIDPGADAKTSVDEFDGALVGSSAVDLGPPPTDEQQGIPGLIDQAKAVLDPTPGVQASDTAKVVPDPSPGVRPSDQMPYAKSFGSVEAGDPTSEYLGDWFAQTEELAQTRTTNLDRTPRDAGPASAIPEAPPDDEPSALSAAATGVIVQSSDDTDAAEAAETDVQTAPESARSGGAPRTLIGSGVAAVIVALVAALIFFGRGTGPTNLTGGTTGGLTGGGGTTPTGSTQASGQPAATGGTATGGGSTTTTLNGGLPMTGVAALANPKGGCPGYTASATSPTTTDVVSGQISLSFGGYSKGLMTGSVASDGTFAVASTDGSVSVQGKLGPTAISGTLTVATNGCTETLQFSIALGSSGGGVTQATPPPFSATIISFNEVSFVQKSLDFCHEPFAVHFDFTIIGIAPNTPVVVQLAGRGTSSERQTFLATSGVKFGTEVIATPGAGVWSDTIVSIGGHPPPSSGSMVSGPIQC